MRPEVYKVSSPTGRCSASHVYATTRKLFLSSGNNSSWPSCRRRPRLPSPTASAGGLAYTLSLLKSSAAPPSALPPSKASSRIRKSAAHPAPPSDAPLVGLLLLPIQIQYITYNRCMHAPCLTMHESSSYGSVYYSSLVNPRQSLSCEAKAGV
jgi:hypothetical protein